MAYNYFMKEVEFQESWNKKRIFFAGIFLIILIVIGLELKGNIISNLLNNKNSRSPSASVKGLKIYENQNKSEFSSDIGSVLQEKLESIKQDAENVNISEIATSSPQVQKIINDIKNLQNLPSNQLKDACLNICKGL